MFLTLGPTLYFVEGDPSTPTTISIVLSQMMDSGALAYNHNSIPIIYFEVLNRYAVFFETNKTYLTIALQSFLDARYHSNLIIGDYFTLLSL